MRKFFLKLLGVQVDAPKDVKKAMEKNGHPTGAAELDKAKIVLF